MSGSRFGTLAQGFISGAVVTASISYSLYQRKPQEPCKEDRPLGNTGRFPFGLPTDKNRVIDYTGHTLYYDAARKQPVWVAELVSKDSLKGKANRKHSKFRRDDSIPEDFSASNSDFWKSGWSRGHMAPAGNTKFSQAAMDDTFYLTNIVPQDIDNNGGFWNRLESHCRDLTQKYQNVHIITGPLYKANKEVNDKSYVEHEVIGQNKVPVPTHLFKIVTAYNSKNDKPAVGAFVVPNIPIQRETNELAKYKVSLKEVQQLTGFVFNPELNNDSTVDLCTAEAGNCKLKGWKEFELYFVRRKLQYAQSMKEIDNVMAQLKKLDIKPDNQLMAQIDNKYAELKMQQVK